MRRRLIASLVLGLGFGVFCVSPAGAAEQTVSGLFTGTDHYELADACLVQQFVDGTGDFVSLGATTIALQFCVTGSFSLGDGTFTLTTTDGTVIGTSAGGAVDPFTFTYFTTLTVTGGTGKYAGASGTLLLEGSLGSPTGPPGVSAPTSGAVTGTIDVPSAVPTTKAQCKGGGWRGLTDEDGRSFRNQGQCVRFVVSVTH